MPNPFEACVAHGTFEFHDRMPKDWVEGSWFSGPGWYFVDESYMLVGPYESKQAAQALFYHYTQFLDRVGG